LSGCNLRPWPSCPGCPPAWRPVGAFVDRGCALGGSDDGGLDEFRDVCLSRASSCATRCSNSLTTTRTVTGVAFQSSSLIPSGGEGFAMIGSLPITKPQLPQSLAPPLCGYLTRWSSLPFWASRRAFDSGIELL